VDSSQIGKFHCSFDDAGSGIDYRSEIIPILEEREEDGLFNVWWKKSSISGRSGSIWLLETRKRLDIMQ